MGMSSGVEILGAGSSTGHPAQEMAAI